jgi:hypothetical protein
VDFPFAGAQPGTSSEGTPPSSSTAAPGSWHMFPSIVRAVTQAGMMMFPGVDGSPLAGVLGRDRRRITAEALIIGCCWGADSEFTDVIRGYVAAPTAYVGCQKQPGKTHGGIVFPPLLEALASLEPGAELDMRVEARREALDKAAADWPAIKPAGWKADCLSPPRMRRSARP